MPLGLYPTPLGLYPTPLGPSPTSLGLCLTPLGLYPVLVGLYATSLGLYPTPLGLYPTLGLLVPGRIQSRILIRNPILRPGAGVVATAAAAPAGRPWCRRAGAYMHGTVRVSLSLCFFGVFITLYYL